MTALSTMLLFFPAFVVGATGFFMTRAVVNHDAWSLIYAALAFYGLPLVAYRVHERFHPLVEGRSHLVGGDYSPWWGGHQIQQVFIAFPMSETLLRVVPGLFSWWLRQWGAQVGARVYWTPHVQIGDRALLTVGDDVVFGHEIGISSHFVQRTKSNVLLYTKRVVIGARAFLGAGVLIGPGVKIADGTVVDAGVHCYPNTAYEGRVRRPRDPGAPDVARAKRASSDDEPAAS